MHAPCSLRMLVPRNRLPDPLLEAHLGCPAQGARRRGIESVTPVVARAIFHERNQFMRFAKAIQDQTNDLDIFPLAVDADIEEVPATGPAMRIGALQSLIPECPRCPENRLQRIAVIGNVNPVALVAAVAVDRNGCIA